MSIYCPLAVVCFDKCPIVTICFRPETLVGSYLMYKFTVLVWTVVSRLAARWQQWMTRQ